MSMSESFYHARGATRFDASESTRGPWSPDHQHAGPPCALLTRAVEQSLPADGDLAVLRISFEILRPVPIGPMRIELEPIHEGRTLRVIEACLTGETGKPLIRARTVASTRRSLKLGGAPTTPELPSPQSSEPFEFDFFSQDTGYHRAMELRLARGAPGQGAAAVWMRMRVPLVDSEPPSPLQRVVTAADSGNGVSYSVDPAAFTFMNPDLTVYLHRPPAGEWVCLDARTRTEDSGIGLADTGLHDENGMIGRSAQSLIILPRPHA
ncbi:MAG: hypothetical protein CMN28_09670 [Salinisphaeraceae bacterium]|jgi:hypothetical protein|nr:hypothetical protein [Salinisphaeraceae bacterium]